MPRRLLCPPRAAQASPRVAYLLVQTSVLLLGCLMVRMMVSPPDFEPEARPAAHDVKRLADRFLGMIPGDPDPHGLYPTLGEPSWCSPDLSGACTGGDSGSPDAESCSTALTSSGAAQSQ